MHHGRSLIYWFRLFIQSHVQMRADMTPALLECLKFLPQWSLCCCTVKLLQSQPSMPKSVTDDKCNFDIVQPKDREKRCLFKASLINVRLLPPKCETVNLQVRKIWSVQEGFVEFAWKFFFFPRTFKVSELKTKWLRLYRPTFRHTFLTIAVFKSSLSACAWTEQLSLNMMILLLR